MTIYDANYAALFTVVYVCGRNLHSFLICQLIIWINCALSTEQLNLKKNILSRSSFLSHYCAPHMTSSTSWHYLVPVANCV
jgi:hypothetical protein